MTPGSVKAGKSVLLRHLDHRRFHIRMRMPGESARRGRISAHRDTDIVRLAVARKRRYLELHDRTVALILHRLQRILLHRLGQGAGRKLALRIGHAKLLPVRRHQPGAFYRLALLIDDDEHRLIALGDAVRIQVSRR